MSDALAIQCYPCTECYRRLRQAKDSRDYSAEKSAIVVPEPVMLATPGKMCDDCMYNLRDEQAQERFAAAVGSIHAKRRWSRLESGLMGQRLRNFTWTISVGGSVRMHSHGYSDEFVEALTYAVNGASSLVISGSQTGIGKTSVAVAVMRRFLDNARHEMAHGREPDGRAVNARMVGEIDLADKDPARAHMAYVRAMRAPWLLLDDVGQLARDDGFKAKEFCGTVRNILDTRERRERSFTLATTWGGEEQWEEWFDGRTMRLYWKEPGAVVLEMRES